MQNAQSERQSKTERQKVKKVNALEREREKGEVLLNGNFAGILFDERTRRAPRAKPMWRSEIIPRKKVRRKVNGDRDELFAILNDATEKRTCQFTPCFFNVGRKIKRLIGGFSRSAIFNKPTASYSGMYTRALSLASHLTATTSSFARWIVRNVLRAETFLFVLLLSLSYTFHRHRSRTLTVPLSRIYPSFCVSRCEFALRYVSFFPSEIAVSFPTSSRIRDRSLKVNEKKKDVEECRHVGRRSYFA